MTRLTILAGGLGTALWLWGLTPPVVDCPCDHARPATLTARVCGLCRTASEQETEFYFLKDINPRKPNRYLALPRPHDRGLQTDGSLPDNIQVCQSMAEFTSPW